MIPIHDFIKKIAQDVEEGDKPEKGRMKYEPEEVRVYFSAPDKPSTETVSEEGNFTWGKGFGEPGYELLFRRQTFDKKGNLMEDKHYIYEIALYPWGLRDTKTPATVTDADPNITEADMTPAEVEQKFGKIVKKPNLYPPGLQGFYINTDKSAPAGENKYPYAKFKSKFRDSDFYKVVNKDTKKLENP